MTPAEKEELKRARGYVAVVNRLETELAAVEARESTLWAALALSLKAMNAPGHAVVHAAMAAAEDALSAPRDTAALDAMLAKANADGEFAVLRLMARADKSATERHYVGAKLPEAVEEHDERMVAAECLKTAAAQSRVAELKAALQRAFKAWDKFGGPHAGAVECGDVDATGPCICGLADLETLVVELGERPDDLEALREFGLKVAKRAMLSDGEGLWPTPGLLDVIVDAVLRGEGGT